MHDVEKPFDRFNNGRPRHLATPGPERDIVEHRKMGEESVLLKNSIDAALVGRNTGLVMTIEEHSTRRGFLEPGDHAQRRGLSAAGRAEQSEELAGGDIENQVAHGYERSE